MMLKKMLSGMAFLVFLSLFLVIHGFAQEDKIGQIAIETIKTHMRFPPGVEVKFIEKKESPIPGFYSVKLSLLSADREIPMIIYVDRAGEIVIIGNIFIKGENVTRKEAGPPKPRKIDMGQLAIDKSPWRGSNHAKVTIVEFSNFQCPSCLSSWKKMKDLMEKNPQDIKYVFKHFPFQSQGNAFELHELVAATQAVNNEAFWAVHDFFFSDEGQAFVNQGKDVLKHKIEQILKERGFDIKTFQVALRNGEGKKRVEEDLALGKKFGVTRTPTAVINGDFLVDPLPEMIAEQYMGK